MEDYYGSDAESANTSETASLNLSFSSSNFEESNFEEHDIQGEIHPYQFEPYAADAEDEDEAQEGGEGLNAAPEFANRLNSTDWCRCQSCQIMPTARECVCCQEVPQVTRVMEEIPALLCIANHPGFQTVCLDVYVLRTAYNAYRQHYREEMVESPERHRHIAYHQFVRWCWGYLGCHNRVVIPSCAVSKIRSTFLTDGEHTGFQEE